MTSRQNDSGRYLGVTGFAADYDEPTSKYLLLFQVEHGKNESIMEMKLSELDALNISRIILETITKTKEAQERR